MVRMPDTLMKLSSLSLVEGMENERGNWLTATKKRSMPMTQHGAGREQRARCKENQENQSNSRRPKVKEFCSCPGGMELQKR